MKSLATSLYTIAQIRKLEQLAIREADVSEQSLMESAGEGAFVALRDQWPEAEMIKIFAGKGNNAGDGYVLARFAHTQGMQVKVRHLGELSDLKGAAKQAADACLSAGVEVRPFNVDETITADVLVDALLGIGLSGEVRTEYATVITKINDAPIPVLAIDIPSGLQADSGYALGYAVHADVTITFIGLKLGLFTGQAPDYTGDVLIDDLAVESNLYVQVAPSALRLRMEDYAELLPERSRIAHKGDFGHVLVVGGDHGMAGAVRMAGEAAYRVGAGLVSIATRPEHVTAVSGACPEIMCHEVRQAKDLNALLAKATVVVIGPGLGCSPWGRALWKAALQSSHPKVVDADGLNLLAKHPAKRNDWILTPHPGEASRLLGCDVASVQQNRYQSLAKIQQKYTGVCILKGAGTLIKAPNLPVAVNTAGNPGMASGGMGDVLSGVLAGLLAQGLSLADAARLGVLIHSLAADKAAETVGERGLLATDLMPYLRWAVNVDG